MERFYDTPELIYLQSDDFQIISQPTIAMFMIIILKLLKVIALSINCCCCRFLLS